MKIQNKKVLITGANRGIGRALVHEALKRRAKTVYAGTHGTLLIVDERVTPLTLDVTSASQIEHAASQVDTLDVLINNAGLAIYDDLSDLDIIRKTLGRESRRFAQSDARVLANAETVKGCHCE